MLTQIRIRDAMADNTFTLTANMSVEEAAVKLQENNLMGAAVVNEEQEVIGFVSEHDLLGKLLSSTYHGDVGTNVAEVMQTKVLSAHPEDSIVESIQLMSQRHSPRTLPVIENKRVVGAITRGLLLKALVKKLMSSK